MSVPAKWRIPGPHERGQKQWRQRRRGARARGARLRGLPQAGADLLRRAGGPHRIFPRGLRHAPALDRGPCLCGPRRALPDAAGADLEPGRDRHRAGKGGAAGRRGGVGRLHAALCGPDGGLRLRRRGLRGHDPRRRPARVEGGRGRSGGAGGLGHGADALPRRAARHGGGARRHRGGAGALGRHACRDHRRRRTRRSVRPPACGE